MNNRDERERIQTLIDRFFDGTTTLDEERRLYAFFASDSVPPEMEEMREMFLDFAAIGIPAAEGAGTVPSTPRRKSSLTVMWWAAACVVAVVLTVFGISVADDIHERRQLASLYGGSYMIVNGKRIDDLSKINTQIEKALTAAEQITRLADNGAVMVKSVERDLLDNISDPLERERIRKLIQ